MKNIKRMMRLISIFTVTIIFVSCQPKSRIYYEHKELSPNVEWLKKDVREFNIPVKDSSILYNLSLSFRYATGYNYNIAKVKITETSPNGKKNTNEFELKIRDEKGDYLGEPGYDIWDSEHLIEPNKKYEEIGTYTYQIEHIMPNDPLNMTMEIGVILDKIE